jgi:8-oxo-dGTP pyrophosphatase MutT (NUDIX family)
MLQPSWKHGTQSCVKNLDAWHILESRSLFKNPHVEVLEERVSLPGEDRIRTWTTVRRKKAVVIAPVTEGGRFVLIHEARVPVRKWLWEFPAGQVDEADEPSSDAIRETARRELTEETGYELIPGGDLTFLGHFYSSQGFTDETQHLFLARPVRPTGKSHQPDQSEAIAECREFTLAELRAMVAGHIIQDANTLGLFARLTAKNLLAD